MEHERIHPSRIDSQVELDNGLLVGLSQKSYTQPKELEGLALRGITAVTHRPLFVPVKRARCSAVFMPGVLYRQDGHTHCTTLSGSHGEWTNTDDVPLGKKSTRWWNSFTSNAGNRLTKTVKNEVKKALISGGISGGRAMAVALGVPQFVPMAGEMGGRLGSSLSKYIGTGTYRPSGLKRRSGGRIAGGRPPVNTTFGRDTVVITATEITGDVYAGAHLIDYAFPLNPGSYTLFPKLAPVAQCYELYQCEQLLVELVPALSPASTNATGNWGITSSTNPDRPAYSNYAAASAASGAVVEQITNSVTYAWECSKAEQVTNWRYVRQSGVTVTRSTSDLGTIQIFENGIGVTPGTRIGSIRVTYRFRLTNTIMPTMKGGYFEYTGSASSTTAHYGTTRAVQVSTGALSGSYIIPVNNAISLPNLMAGDIIKYTYYCSAASAAFSTAPTLSTTNLSYYSTPPYGSALASGAVAIGQPVALSYYLIATAGGCTIAFSAGTAFIGGNVSVSIQHLGNGVSPMNTGDGYNGGGLFAPGPMVGADVNPSPPAPKPLPVPPEPVIGNASDGVGLDARTPHDLTACVMPVLDDEDQDSTARPNYVAVEALSEEEVQLIETMRRARINAST